jgi:hypothetical protein
VREYFEKLWGLPHSGKWRGYRIKTLRDSADNVIINVPDGESKGEEEEDIEE